MYGYTTASRDTFWWGGRSRYITICPIHSLLGENRELNNTQLKYTGNTSGKIFNNR
jgi:hypothetical protein